MYVCNVCMYVCAVVVILHRTLNMSDYYHISVCKLFYVL